MSSCYFNFIDGLIKATGDKDLDNYKYFGGNKNQHLNYLHMLIKEHKNRNVEIPSAKPMCLCKTRINEQCYIQHIPTQLILNVGNCCIKKFLDKSGRTCSNCEEPHQNRKNNYCNDCREQNKRAYFREIPLRIYLKVPYSQKEEAKVLGARYNPEKKQWYAPNNSFESLIKQFA